MINYKNGISKVKYPNIPNPCLQTIQSGNFIASRSLNNENILISKIDVTDISLEENPEFCDIAYKIYLHDEYGYNTENIQIIQVLNEDNKYISVKGINLERTENNKLERKL